MILLKSVFNLDLDLQLPRYGEIAKSEYIFCLLIFSLILFLSYKNKSQRYTQLSTWWLVLVYCLYAFWDTDYFTFATSYYRGLDDFRDPLYMYLKVISLNSYIIFRFYIWGVALWLYYLTTKRFRLSPNKSIFIFSIFFLSTFCYGRVSLGMSLYFWGLSFLLKRKYNFFRSIVPTIIFFVLAFFAHRSIALLILVTPLIYIKLSKRLLKVGIILALLSILGLRSFIINLISSNVSDSNVLGAAAAHYLQYTYEENLNWKYALMTYAHNCSFLLLGVYVGYILLKQRNIAIIPRWLRQLYIPTAAVLVIGFIFWTMPGFGIQVMGYRFIYLTGIPLCLMTTELYEAKLIQKRYFHYIIVISLLYSEGFLIGKIISGS